MAVALSRCRYRNLALKWHPLRCEDADAQSNFDEVSEAFEVLSSYELRALFDKFGEIALKEGVADGNGGACASIGWTARTVHRSLTELLWACRFPGRQLCLRVQRQ